MLVRLLHDVEALATALQARELLHGSLVFVMRGDRILPILVRPAALVALLVLVDD